VIWSATQHDHKLTCMCIHLIVVTVSDPRLASTTCIHMPSLPLQENILGFFGLFAQVATVITY
jgi:hypothetical protein